MAKCNIKFEIVGTNIIGSSVFVTGRGTKDGKLYTARLNPHEVNNKGNIKQRLLEVYKVKNSQTPIKVGEII